MRNLKKNKTFQVIDYQGKQIRDILHLFDLTRAFYLYYKNPKKGEVYNLGGGRENSVSFLEINDILGKILGKRLKLILLINQEKVIISDRELIFRNLILSYFLSIL